MVGFWKKHATLLILAGFLSASALAVWAAASEDIWSALSRLGPREFSLLLGLSLINYLLRAARWSFFLRALGARLPFDTTALHYFGGFAMTVTPARVGELVRLRWASRATEQPFEKVAPLVLFDRASDLGAIGLLLGADLLSGRSGFAGGLLATTFAVSFAVVSTRPGLFRAVIDVAYRLVRRRPRSFVRARRAARALTPFSRPSVFIPALGLGVFGWLAEGAAFYLLLGWLGAPLPLGMCVAVFLFATMSGGATGMPGGVGGAEAVMLGLLLALRVPMDTAIAATAIIRITTLWFAVGLGMLVFPIAESMVRGNVGRDALAREGGQPTEAQDKAANRDDAAAASRDDLRNATGPLAPGASVTSPIEAATIAGAASEAVAGAAATPGRASMGGKIDALEDD